MLVKGKEYTVDCNYVIKVSQYMRLIPIILVESGEEPWNREH